MSIQQFLVANGVHNRYWFHGKTAAESISKEVFNDRFSLMINISWGSVEDYFT